MIVTVRKRSLVLGLIFTVLSIIAIGLYAYLGTESRQTVVVPLIEKRMELYHKEHILFLCLVLSSMVLYGGSRLLKNSRNLSKELKIITNLSRIKDFSPGTRLKKLGEAGVLISDLYFELNRLGLQKSLKISGQSVLIGFLVDNINKPLIVTLHTGEITHIGTELLKTWGIVRTDIEGKTIDWIIPGLPVYELMQNARTQFKELKFSYSNPKPGENVSDNTRESNGFLHIIFNREQEIAYGVWVFTDAPFMQKPVEIKVVKKKGRDLQRIFSRVFRRSSD